MSTHDGQDFAEAFLAHAYDPVKAHEYYERTKKLKGRKPGSGKQSSNDKAPDKSRRARAGAIATNAAADVGPERSAAIQRLAEQAKEQLSKLTEEFRSWVSSHPKVTDAQRFAKRREMLDRKDDIIRTLKSDVAKITSAASSKKTPKAATEGRHH